MKFTTPLGSKPSRQHPESNTHPASIPFKYSLIKTVSVKIRSCRKINRIRLHWWNDAAELCSQSKSK